MPALMDITPIVGGLNDAGCCEGVGAVICESGAARGIRTPDPVITNDVLYQLSYCGGPNAAFGNCLETRGS